ncbi:IS3 family transposase [bacterium]|nr:IS3 family transposase [bacterium]
MDLSRSTYYYKSKDKPTDILRKEADIQDRIEGIACEYPRYGYRIITKQLHREEFMVNHKKVLRIMRENSLLCSVTRKWIKTTDYRHQIVKISEFDKGKVCRYHLYPHNDVICLPCSDSRYFFSEGCELCHIEEFEHRLNYSSIESSNFFEKSRKRLYSSF